MSSFSYAKRNAKLVLAFVDSLELSQMSAEQLEKLYHLVSSIDAEVGTCFMWGEPYDDTCESIRSACRTISEALQS